MVSLSMAITQIMDAIITAMAVPIGTVIITEAVMVIGATPVMANLLAPGKNLMATIIIAADTAGIDKRFQKGS